MQPDIAKPLIRPASLGDTLPAAWRWPLARLALALAGLLLLTIGDWIAMAEQWWNVSTYSHVLFIGPIAGFLIWQRREVLARLNPAAWWPGLVLVAGALFLWLLGTLASANTASQLGAVLAMQAAVLTLLGPRVVWSILFPLAYLVLLVPFGDELVPALQMVTAKLVIALTEFSGIPAEIEGVFIDTPVGLFEVAEACSGVKFLVAMFALGVLVDQTCFASWKRRAIFMAAALALPIIANALRAWGTIAIAQVQGIEFAEGFDHIFYGWVFFALVVAALLGGFWRWFDRSLDDQPVMLAELEQAALPNRLEAFGGIGGNAALVAMLAGTILFAAWSAAALRIEAALPAEIALPEVAGWQRADYDPQLAWEPRASGAQHRLFGRYRNPEGREVDVFIALYAAQDDGREASAPGEGALTPGTPWRWMEAGPAQAGALSDWYFALGSVRRLAQTHYRIGDLTTGSPAMLKLANMRDRLMLRARPTAMLIISAEQRGDSDPVADIGQFRQAIGRNPNEAGEWMDRIAAGS